MFLDFNVELLGASAEFLDSGVRYDLKVSRFQEKIDENFANTLLKSKALVIKCKCKELQKSCELVQ